MDIPGRLCNDHSCDDKQGTNMLYWMGLSFADLALMHEGDLGNPGHDPAALCGYPTSAACRLHVFSGCLAWMARGGTRACGVANWELEWLEELKVAKVRGDLEMLPAVVQLKFHPHQSLASPRIKAIYDFCVENEIVFNGCECDL